MTQHSHPNAPTQFVDTANFAARDENIRCLSYGVLRKLAGLPQICSQTIGAMSSGRSAHDFPASATTCSTTFHRTTGRISGLCRTAFTAWTSCSTAPRKSASPTSTA